MNIIHFDSFGPNLSKMKNFDFLDPDLSKTEFRGQNFKNLSVDSELPPP